jgi:hypothetical protein
MTHLQQLKGITVGGAIAGGAVGASSINYGYVHDTLISAEVFLPCGEIVTCSAVENQELFSALANSYGSLGYSEFALISRFLDQDWFVGRLLIHLLHPSSARENQTCAMLRICLHSPRSLSFS